MIVNSKKIISDTLNVFNQSLSQKEKFLKIKSHVDEIDYRILHRNFLTPLSIKIDCDLFLKEIIQYSDYFEQWGTYHTHLPRYGIALVNQDGILKKQDPINGSLYEWNLKYPDNPIIETDCLTPTKILKLKSLEPLSIFKNHWCRSNILKWHTTAEFKPHIDTVIPSPWLRLWATTDPINLHIRFEKKENNLSRVTNIEKGRIYIIDTSIVHDAISYGDDIYQLFLGVLPSSINILKGKICRA